MADTITSIHHRLHKLEQDVATLKRKLRVKTSVKVSRSLSKKRTPKKMTDEEIARLVQWERESVGSEIDREISPTEGK